MDQKRRFYVDIMALHPEVTGSCILVIVKYPNGETLRFIVDCGMFLGNGEYNHYNESFPFDPQKIKFCLVTHNHIDHIGRLPLLVRKKFEGKIFSTEATSSFAHKALNDCCGTIEELAKRNHTKKLYGRKDVFFTRFSPCAYYETINVEEGIKVTFLPNGHLVGSAMILVQISYPGCKDINLLFTGDYNNKNMFFDVPDIPKWILELPLTIITESTYGTTESTEINGCFEKNILDCMKNENATAVCMVHSLGRAQEILYVLKILQDEGKLDSQIPIYLDGDLAQEYTNMYIEKEKLGIKEEMRNFLPKNFKFVDKEMRQELLKSTNSKVILATSGNGMYGPSQRYIVKYISEKNCLLQFTSKTKEGSLAGRLCSANYEEVVSIGSIFRQKIAKVEYSNEFSAHAKADEIIEFLKKFKNIKLTLVNHGQIEVKYQFSKRITKELRNTECVAILGRDYFFRVNDEGLIQQVSTKFE